MVEAPETWQNPRERRGLAIVGGLATLIVLNLVLWYAGDWSLVPYCVGFTTGGILVALTAMLSEK